MRVIKPAQLTVQLLLGETVMRETTVAPAYADFRSNGEGCDPVCSAAEFTF